MLTQKPEIFNERHQIQVFSSNESREKPVEVRMKVISEIYNFLQLKNVTLWHVQENWRGAEVLEKIFSIIMMLPNYARNVSIRYSADG